MALSFDFNEFDDEVDEDDELSGTNSPVHDVHEHTQPVVGIASCVIVIIILQRLTHHVLVIRMTNRRGVVFSFHAFHNHHYCIYTNRQHLMTLTGAS